MFEVQQQVLDLLISDKTDQEKITALLTLLNTDRLTNFDVASDNENTFFQKIKNLYQENKISKDIFNTLSTHQKGIRALRTLMGAYAIDANNIVIQLLQHTAKIIPVEEQLFQACKNGELTEVNRLATLISQEKNQPLATVINSLQDSQGNSLLLLACNHNQLSVVRWLIFAGANEDINQANPHGWTPLHFACKMGNIELMIELLAHGAKASIAATTNKVEEIDNRLTPMEVFRFYTNSDLTEETIEWLFLIWGQSRDLCEVLHHAAREGHFLMRTFLNIKLIKDQINTLDKDGNTALMSACNRNRIDTALLLIENGAKIDYINHEGDTALLSACTTRSLSLVQSILNQPEGSLFINRPNKAGRTPLRTVLNFLPHSPLFKGYEESIKIFSLLFKHGASTSVNFSGPSQETLILRKLRNYRTLIGNHVPELHQTMLDHGAAVLKYDGPEYQEKIIQTKHIFYSYPDAIRNYYSLRSIIKQISKYKTIEGKIRYPDSNKTRSGLTPLHLACFDDHIEGVQWLLLNSSNKEEDITAKDSEQWTPFHAALANGSIEIIQLLLQECALPLLTEFSRPNSAKEFEALWNNNQNSAKGAPWEALQQAIITVYQTTIDTFFSKINYDEIDLLLQELCQFNANLALKYTHRLYRELIQQASTDYRFEKVVAIFVRNNTFLQAEEEFKELLSAYIKCQPLTEVDQNPETSAQLLQCLRLWPDVHELTLWGRALLARLGNPVGENVTVLSVAYFIAQPTRYCQPGMLQLDPDLLKTAFPHGFVLLEQHCSQLNKYRLPAAETNLLKLIANHGTCQQFNDFCKEMSAHQLYASVWAVTDHLATIPAHVRFNPDTKANYEAIIIAETALWRIHSYLHNVDKQKLPGYEIKLQNFTELLGNLLRAQQDQDINGIINEFLVAKYKKFVDKFSNGVFGDVLRGDPFITLLEQLASAPAAVLSIRLTEYTQFVSMDMSGQKTVNALIGSVVSNATSLSLSTSSSLSADRTQEDEKRKVYSSFNK